MDQEIRNMEMLHQQVQRKKEKMARLADLQRQIDEASEEVRHLTQDEQCWGLVLKCYELRTRQHRKY